MNILLAKKQIVPSFILAITTLFFSSLSFSYNPGLAFDSSRNIIGTAIDESKQGCVYRDSNVSGGAWQVADCDYVGAHYACFNGSEWRVAESLGTTDYPGEPIDGDSANNIKSVNSWDPVKADSQCKNYFGPSYFFSVPVSAEEDEQLGSAIANISAGKKRTWIYYYSNTNSFELTQNYWLGNRTEFTNFFLGNILTTNTEVLPGTKDCVVMHRSTPQGLWQQASCAEKRSFACFVNGDWKITKAQDRWKAGFAVCEKEFGQQALYAVPRDSAENTAIKAAALPSGGTNNAIDYNKVWLNQTDLAFEEFFISNQTRSAWWGEGQPSNRGNADCALVDSKGHWIAESCNGVVAKHACFLGENADASNAWVISSKKGESALGFGYCKQQDEASEYRPPNSKFYNDGLATHIAEGEYVWVNYSDQVSEGYWQVSMPFQDFVSVSGVLDGDAQDCGYFSLETDNKRNWLAGQCFAGGASLTQGFACTNGYEWKIATEANGTSLESDLWKGGFDSCKDAFGQDYEFSAPFDAHENSKLKLALQLSGKTRVWLNVNDSKSEGDWVANGPVVNLSPVITDITEERVFPEKTDIELSVSALDPEAGNSNGLVYNWSIIGQRTGVDGLGTDIVTQLDDSDLSFNVSGTPNTVTVSKSKLNLLNYDYYIDLQLKITDADATAPATTTKNITLQVKSPLRAAYDFNNYTQPGLDISGNGHNLELNVSQVEITPRENISDDYFAKLGAQDSFSIKGGSYDVNGKLIGGLELDASKDQYTVIYRFRVDELPVGAGNWAGFMQKGTSLRQPGVFLNKDTLQIQASSSTSTEPNENVMSNERVRVGQWMTVAYVKDINDLTGFAAGNYVRLYIDKAEDNLLDPVSLRSAPDSTLTIPAPGTGYETGEDWIFGKVPGSPEGIVGGLDDIRIYDRALTTSELVSIFKDQPKGEFQFVNQQESGEEHEVEGSVNTVSIPVSRVKGDDGEVSVGFKLISGTATINTDFRLQGDTSTGTDPVVGTLTWGVHDTADKNIAVELIGDSLREGTETFSIELEELSAQTALGKNTKVDVNIVDKTPNPYGSIGFAPTTITENISVQEGSSGAVTVERIGTDSVGSFDVLYEIRSINAHIPDDFAITGDSSSSYVATGNTGVGVLIGSGRLKFAEGLGQTRQTETINFTTKTDVLPEFDEYFTVELLKVTDPNGSDLANPDTSAILGTNRFYTQAIKDKTTGRISFVNSTYSADEVDQGAGTNVVTVELERLAGTDGAICLTLDTSASSASGDDYIIQYLNPSASGSEDVFWADGDASNKSVMITINDDNVYDPNEEIQLSWNAQSSCNSIATVFPDSSQVGDNTGSSISIVDYTNPVQLTFSSNAYTVSELTPVKTITIKATQTDFNNPENNNAFKVFLNRAAGSAVEGTHYGDLTNQQVISFAAGETEKTIDIPIVDNCDAASSLEFGFGLSKTDSTLNNNIPDTLINVASATSKLTIENGSNPISFNGLLHDFTGIAARIRPDWKGDGRLYVTGKVDSSDLNPEMTEMGIKADVSHNCLNELEFNWSLAVSATGAQLPSGNGLPNNFSVLPVIAGSSSDQTLTEKFKLPFVIKDTDLVVNLSITDPETGVTYNKSNVPDLERVFTVTQNFRAIQNNGEANDCIDWEGVNARVKNKSCNTIDRQNGIAYHPDTQQLVFGQESGGLSCVTHDGGNDWLYGRYCGTSSTSFAQKWSVTGARVNSLDNSGIFFMESGGEPFARTDSGWYTVGAKRWTWLNLQGTYLP